MSTPSLKDLLEHPPLSPREAAEEKAWKATCFALVASNGNDAGFVLYYGGGLSLQKEIDSLGRDIFDLGLKRAPEGLSVWEGIYKVYEYSNYEGPLEADVLPEGKFRAPTDIEWRYIQRGESPWPLLTPESFLQERSNGQETTWN